MRVQHIFPRYAPCMTAEEVDAMRATLTAELAQLDGGALTLSPDRQNRTRAMLQRAINECADLRKQQLAAA